jgi:hypothetical protein
VQVPGHPPLLDQLARLAPRLRVLSVQLLPAPLAAAPPPPRAPHAPEDGGAGGDGGGPLAALRPLASLCELRLSSGGSQIWDASAGGAQAGSGGPGGAATLLQLAALRHLSGLRSLDLVSFTPAAGELAQLGRALHGLTRLAVADGARALGRVSAGGPAAALLGRLRELRVAARCDEAGAGWLVAARRGGAVLAHLTRLVLGDFSERCAGASCHRLA